MLILKHGSQFKKYSVFNEINLTLCSRDFLCCMFLVCASCGHAIYFTKEEKQVLSNELQMTANRAASQAEHR